MALLLDEESAFDVGSLVLTIAIAVAAMQHVRLENKLFATQAVVTSEAPNLDDARCLQTRSAAGVYSIPDDSMRVAVVAGCVTAWMPRQSLWTLGGTLRANEWVSLRRRPLAWHLGGKPDEVILLPDDNHEALAGDGIVLAVGSDGELTLFERSGMNITWKQTLRLRQRFDDSESIRLRDSPATCSTSSSSCHLSLDAAPTCTGRR